MQLKLPIFIDWHEMESILRRAASMRPKDWNLPVTACRAFGKSAEQAIPASAALACTQINIILVEDMLDDDPRGISSYWQWKSRELYGEMIHDNLNDTMVVPANPDWLQGRKPLPILFAQTVEHPVANDLCSCIKRYLLKTL